MAKINLIPIIFNFALFFLILLSYGKRKFSYFALENMSIILTMIFFIFCILGRIMRIKVFRRIVGFFLFTLLSFSSFVLFCYLFDFFTQSNYFYYKIYYSNLTYLNIVGIYFAPFFMNCIDIMEFKKVFNLLQIAITTSMLCAYYTLILISNRIFLKDAQYLFIEDGGFLIWTVPYCIILIFIFFLEFFYISLNKISYFFVLKNKK